MKHVIIDGPDGAGKSVLARELCDHYDLAYHHEGPPPPTKDLNYFLDLLVEATQPTVFDRLHLTEHVYGPILRGRSSLSSDDIQRISGFIRATGTAMVCCYPPWTTCLANTRVKKELIQEEGTLLIVYESWGTVFDTRRLLVNAQRYDYTVESFLLEGYPDRFQLGNYL